MHCVDHNIVFTRGNLFDPITWHNWLKFCAVIIIFIFSHTVNSLARYSMIIKASNNSIVWWPKFKKKIKLRWGEGNDGYWQTKVIFIKIGLKQFILIIQRWMVYIQRWNICFHLILSDTIYILFDSFSFYIILGVFLFQNFLFSFFFYIKMKIFYMKI